MSKILRCAIAAGLCALSGAATAGLTTAGTWTGTVGLSVDGIGSNNTPVGDVQASIPIGATILQAFLYSAGTPTASNYPLSPRTLADYNSAGITLAGTAITNFDTLVGGVSPRSDIVSWATGRADVTSLVRSLTAGAATSSFSWTVGEGAARNAGIDGEVLAIVYSAPGLAQGSVALLNGGQNTGGETSFVNLGSPLSDPTAAGFSAQLGLGISFSCCDSQRSTVRANGGLVTDNAGNNDDGLVVADGSLITVGGLGDTPANNQSYANDHELYNLAPFLHTGDTSFSIFTENASGDDNIFFASLYLTGDITTITPGVPEPETYAMMLGGLALLGAAARRRQRR